MTCFIIVFSLLLLQFSYAGIVSVNNNFPSTELKALQDLYYNTNGQFWTWKQTGKQWNFTEMNPNPCYEQWEGIECTSNCLEISECNVKNISLSDHNLAGVLTNSIGNFHELQRLDLRTNWLYSAIPNEVGNLTKLILLDFSDNSLYGTLPASIEQMINLEILAIVNNRLFGNIPSNIFHLPKLQWLDLEDNILLGTIPTTIGNSTELRILMLGYNSFTGTLPDALCDLKTLEVFVVTHNLLGGHVPPNITNLTNLRMLDISYNLLSGSISENIIEYLTELRIFQINENLFAGKLPDNMQYVPQLEVFDVGYNEFSGCLPNSIVFCKNLSYLSFHGNYFVGSIPAEYGNLDRLIALYFFDNLMFGTIPSNITTLTRLIVLELEYNAFSGTIPEALGDLHHLLYLGLNDNLFHGSLPKSIANLNNLLTGTFQNNRFTGTLPFTIEKNWSKVEVLSLQNNFFSGRIDFIANMHSVTNINISTNKFSGNINNIILDFPFLYSLDVSNNKLTGTLNHVFDQMPTLFDLNVAHNQFSGDLNNIFVSIDLVLVDISDNIFSGTLPADVFKLLALQTFAAVKNCLTGTLPTDTICHSKTLHILALDGLHTAEHCQDRFFPTLSSIITTYQLAGASKGSLPRCLFNMTALNTLHLSGNGFTGSIPSNVMVSKKLSDVSLSNNQLTGSIPDWMQQTVWKNLDVSFNKLNGILKSTFTASSNSSSLAMIVNRLSGDIPTTLLTADYHLDMLQGNIFRCDANGGMLGDASRSLPDADAESSTYDCGSDSVNTAMYIWLIVAGSIAISGIIVMIGITKIKEIAMREDELCVAESAHEFSTCKKFIVNVQNGVRSWQRHIEILLSSSTTNGHIGRTENEQNESCECGSIQEKNIVLSMDSNSIYILGKSLTMIRTMAWRIASFALLILLPVYCILANSFSTHSHVYIWTVALAYLSGWVPAMVVFAIMVIFYTFLASRLIELGLHSVDYFYHKRRYFESGFSFNRLYSYVAFHQFSRSDGRKTCVYLAIILVNVIIVLAVNVAYVYTTTLSLNQSSIFFVEVTVSLFKISWSSFAVSYVFSRILNHHTHDTVSDKQTENHVVEKLKFLSQLTIFNNIIAPFLADSFVDPNCFRYVINSQSAVTTSYSTGTCYQYDFILISGPSIQMQCERFHFTTISTLYTPPFVYSYQCSSALLNGFVNVFIYRYLITGILLPCTKLLILYLDDQYEILNVPFRYLQQLMGIIDVANSQQQKKDVEVPQCQNNSATIELQTLESNKASTLNPILIKELNTTEKDEIVMPSTEKRSVSESATSEKLIFIEISRRIFNREAIIVAIVGDFAVLLTFGLTFPPLAVMIAVSIASTTYYNQLILSRMVAMLQVAMINPVINCVSSLYGEVNQRISIWCLSKATVELLTPSEAQSLFKQIIANCGENLLYLFWPMIPSLAILSAVFIGAFLFDILGDEVGVLQALWILLVMGTMPLWIWCGEYLHLACVNAYNNKLQKRKDLEDEMQEVERHKKGNE